jgi:hypothetical protein
LIAVDPVWDAALQLSITSKIMQLEVFREQFGDVINADALRGETWAV